MLKCIKDYVKDTRAVSGSVEQIMMIVICVAGASVVAYMIYKGISAGQKAMGEDFNMGG